MSRWPQHYLSWEAVVSKGNTRIFGAALTEERNRAKAGVTAQMHPWQTLVCHAVLPEEKAEAVCLQGSLWTCRASSAVRFCTKPLPDIQERPTLTYSHDCLLGCFLTIGG